MRTRAAAFLTRGVVVAALSALSLVSTGVVTTSFAQSRGRSTTAKPKPTKTISDAGAAESALDDGGAAASMTSSGAVDGGLSPVLKPEVFEGGIKPSPLNPQANELPPVAPASSGAGGAAGAGVTTTADYDKILGEISALRARVAAVQDGLFHSRVAIALQTEGSAKIGRLTISLDDGVVYTAPANFRAEDSTAVYEHAVSPGRHAITIDVDRKDERDEAFRTSQRSRFVVDVPKDQRLAVELRVSDDSTMGADFPGDRSGRYDLRVRMKVAARAVAR